MSKPRAKQPSKSVKIYCSKCKQKLLHYRKGGSGTLVKCFIERISKDFTFMQGQCPNCNETFARESLIRGVPALKIIGGKVIVK
jgi:ssDNA-binding Zn-finger/Zn-ribbon topoisomerase 1